jgi:hypothetical protein
MRIRTYNGLYLISKLEKQRLDETSIIIYNNIFFIIYIYIYIYILF